MRNADFLEGGKFEKFLVLKHEDIDQFLSESEARALWEFCDTICDSRQVAGKRRGNHYLVINVDEPYAPEIVEILKRNGHWG